MLTFFPGEFKANGRLVLSEFGSHSITHVLVQQVTIDRASFAGVKDANPVNSEPS